VHLIDDIHLVFAGLRRETHLLHKRADIVNGVITRGIQLVDIKRSAVIKGNTGSAFVAGFTVRRYIFAIDRLGENAGAGCFTDATWTAEQESMS
jgi:hypothetical protein